MNNLKILVADDDPYLLEICTEILELEGYTVDMAHDGAEALSKLYADGIDGALLDVMMPGVDGITVCKVLKNDPNMKKMPIIMMSASHSALREAKHCATAVISKPFDLDNLISTMQHCIQPT